MSKKLKVEGLENVFSLLKMKHDFNIFFLSMIVRCQPHIFFYYVFPIKI